MSEYELGHRESFTNHDRWVGQTDLPEEELLDPAHLLAAHGDHGLAGADHGNECAEVERKRDRLSGLSSQGEITAHTCSASYCSFFSASEGSFGFAFSRNSCAVGAADDRAARDGGKHFFCRFVCAHIRCLSNLILKTVEEGSDLGDS